MGTYDCLFIQTIHQTKLFSLLYLKSFLTYFTILKTGFLFVGEGLVILDVVFPNKLPSISSTTSGTAGTTGAVVVVVVATGAILEGDISKNRS